MSQPFDDELRRARLLVTAGSGGVGKTTTAAAMAVRAAALGRRAAVLTIDPARRLADALGLGELTGELRRVEPRHFEAAGLTAEGELWAMMLDVKTTGDQMVRRFAPDPQTARAILDNPYYQYFSTSLAGAQEYVAIEQVRALIDEGGFDLVVLDTPPAAHAIDFLDAPDRLVAGLGSRAVQMLRSDDDDAGFGARLTRGGRGLILRGLNKLTGGPFIEELTRFLSVFGSIIDALKASGEAVKARLRADDTRFFLVTSPTRSNVDEAVSFRGQLASRGFPLGGVILNRAHVPLEPVADDVETRSALDDALGASGLADIGPQRRAAVLDGCYWSLDRHNRLADLDKSAADTLEHATGRRPWRIPLFAHEIRDLSDLDRVARALRPVEGAAAASDV